MGDWFTNMLSPWQWALLALVPPAIIALYFLKLRREPLEVPSTFLWSRTIEDLHVNSLWQRMRQNLLLYLQLLLVTLLMLACVRPGCQGTILTGQRFVFVVDASASMSATDVAPTRLDAAKKNVVELINQMKSSDTAMVISFSNVAKVEQGFTNNRQLLRDRVAQIKQTNRVTNLSEALRAAVGLAGPGENSANSGAEGATMYLFSDGGVVDLPEFKLGGLEPKYMKIGTDHPENVAIAAFNVSRNPERPAQHQAFARLENYGPKEISVSVQLTVTRGGKLVSASKEPIKLPASTLAPMKENAATTSSETKLNTECHPGRGAVQFNLEDAEDALLTLEILNQDGNAYKDALELDNVAYASVAAPRLTRVLVVTPSNEALRLALITDESKKLADIKEKEPKYLDEKEYEEQSAAGLYDLIIFDRCAPKKMPQANTLFIAAVPPGDLWKQGKTQGPPVIIDTDRSHPLLALVELGNVTVAEAFPVPPPSGGRVLIDGDIGPLFSIAAREGYEDAVLGFAIIATDKDGKKQFHTDWYKRLSFPVFLKNVLEYLGGSASGTALTNVTPGTPMILRSQIPVATMTIIDPNKGKLVVNREAQGNFVYTQTNERGVYDVLEGTAQQASQRFAVNLFDQRESDLHPSQQIKLGYETVIADAGSQRARKEWWKWLLLGALGVLIFEWYVYNRRVYF